MTPDLETSLRAAVAARRVVVVVGSGVSVAATAGSPPATWAGLLEAGVERVRTVVGPDAIQTGAILDDIASGDHRILEGVASRIAHLLGGPTSPQFAEWIQQSVGQLRLIHREPIDAVLALGLPVITTNYDGLIEEAGALGAVAWPARGLFGEVLEGKRADLVAHLHGSWHDPSSLLVSKSELDNFYETELPRLLTLAHGRSLLLVGYEAHDPSVTRLLSLLSDEASGNAHYWLCNRAAVAAVRDACDMVHPVVYGDRFSDLTGFLRRLVAQRSEIHPIGSSLPPKPQLVGRDIELNYVVEHIITPTSGRRFVTISGSPGIGKTTLALAAAHQPRVAKRFGDRRWYLDCGACTNAEDVLRSIARIIRVQATASDPAVWSMVRSVLGRAPSLLLLDGIESPLSSDRPATLHILNRLRRTTRTAVVVAGRDVHRAGLVGPQVELDPLTHSDARRLFIRLAGRSYDTADLDELIRIAGGSPLAIVVLAQSARSRPIDLRTLSAQWLAERTAMLTEVKHGSQQTLRVAIELSLSRIAADESAFRLLRLLALLPDGASLDDLPSLQPGRGEGAVTLLTANALAQVRDRRLHLHDLVRHYVLELAASHDDVERMVAHYLSLVRDAPHVVSDAGSRSSRARIHNDARNIEYAIRLALATANPHDGIDAAIKFAMLAPGLPETIGLLRQAEGRAEEIGDLLVRATVACALGDRARYAGSFDVAREEYRRALESFRQSGDLAGEARCLERLGDIALGSAEFESAVDRYEQASKLYRTRRDRLGEASCKASLGDVEFSQGNHSEAVNRYRIALKTFQGLGDIRGAARCQRRLGDAELARARHSAAGRWYYEALGASRKVGDTFGEAECLRRLGDLTLVRRERVEQPAADSLDLIEVGIAAIPARVFLMYASTDRPTAETLGFALRGRGIDVLLVDWLTAGRDDIAQTLLASVRARDVVVVVLSSEAARTADSEDLDRALSSRDVDIVPVVIADVDLPERFSALQVMDLRSMGSEEIAQLAERIAISSSIDVRDMDPPQFEALVMDLLAREGFGVVHRSPQDEFDFYLERRSFETTLERIAVQVKTYGRARASVAALTAFATHLGRRDDVNGGILVTNAQLTSIALRTLSDLNNERAVRIAAIDGPGLRRMLLRHPDVITRHHAASFGVDEWPLR